MSDKVAVTFTEEEKVDIQEWLEMGLYKETHEFVLMRVGAALEVDVL